MSIVGKKVLVLKNVGNHFHTDALCPMVQDPQSDKEYTLEKVEKLNDRYAKIAGKWYIPCGCSTTKLGKTLQ